MTTKIRTVKLKAGDLLQIKDENNQTVVVMQIDPTTPIRRVSIGVGEYQFDWSDRARKQIEESM